MVDDSAFQVKQVEVRGAYYLNASDVARIAGLVGMPLLRVSTADTERRIMGLQVPRDVTVRFRPPDVAVVVLNERTASYLWSASSIVYAVSDDGVVLGPAKDTGTRVVVVSDARAIRPGDRVDPAILREAGYLASVLPTVAGFVPTTIRYSPDLGLVVVGPRNVQIIVGDDRLLEQKVAALAPSLGALPARPGAPPTIDVRVPTRPIVR